MATPYSALIRTLSNGEAVEAGVTNRPTGDLALRTQYLKETLDALVAGQAIFARQVALDPGAQAGQPVYQGADGVFHPGLSGLGQALAGGPAAPSAYIRGVLYQKTSSTLGDVMLQGRFPGTIAGWGAHFDGGTATPGEVWLSSQVAGNLTSLSGGLSVYVGHLDVSGDLYVQPAAPVAGQHAHYQVNLSGAPSGTVTDPTVGSVHVVTTPDTTVQGWLPATSTYFPGWVSGVQIPVGAAFGYNLQHPAESALRNLFPPIPPEAAVGIQQGLELSGLLVCNAYGIWWLSNAYGQAPWPVDYGAVGQTNTISLRFVRYAALSPLPLVTDISPDPTSPVPVQILGSTTGSPASQGSLKVRIPGLFTSTITTDEDFLAVKQVTGAGVQSRGPVVARLIAGAGALVTAANGDGTLGHYGDVTVALSSSEALQGTGAIGQLNGASTGSLNDLPITALSSGVDSSPVWSIKLSESAPGTNQVNLSVILTSSVAGVTPAGFDWRYRVITPTTGGVTLGTTWSSATSLAGATLLANGCRTLALGAITGVPRSSVVLVQIRRTGSSDPYGGQLGVDRLVYTLS